MTLENKRQKGVSRTTIVTDYHRVEPEIEQADLTGYVRSDCVAHDQTMRRLLYLLLVAMFVSRLNNAATVERSDRNRSQDSRR
jgi:hypothetical protein